LSTIIKLRKMSNILNSLEAEVRLSQWILETKIQSDPLVSTLTIG
jgi:hypothetical protein